MGRKIPGRKHRGVRDPKKQIAERLASLKDKINAPPTNPDDQYVPKSLSRIIELKQKAKSGEFVKKKNKTPKKHSQFEQKRGESDSAYLFRVKRACNAAIQEAAFEKKYGVQVKRNPETGKVEEVIKRKPDEIDELMRKARKQKCKRKKEKVPELTKAERRKKKLQVKKEKKMENDIDEFKCFKDEVKFGEVVHQPPNLMIPKKGEAKIVPRPGCKDLHLKSLLNPNKKRSDDKLRKTANKVIDRKGKRKDLPLGVRRQLDRQQKEMMEVYKQLKEQKNNKSI